MRHLLDTTDLSLEEVDGIISTAIDIINNKEKYAHVCDGKKLATLFFEPSTRTRLSFEAAMMELGGNVLGFSEAEVHLLQRVKRLRILSEWYPVMPILLQCAILLKVHRE